MWKRKNSINHEILKYFLIFSILTILFLWILQSLLFKTLYETQKKNDIERVATKIKKYRYNLDFEYIINSLSMDNSVCIEIDSKDSEIIYSSKFYGKGCLNKDNDYKEKFINSNKEEKIYEITNRDFNNKTILYAVKLDSERYAFINSPIEPIDGTKALITKQLIVITIVILILSFILAYFISNHISKPIKETTNKAKDFAKGKFDIEFDNDSNILEIKELNNTLNYAKDELSKTEELRRDLMANVSHDLKTPLTMIKAYAEMSMDLHSNDKEKQKEDMETIISETDRLTLLVNDILELSKMQSNIKQLDITEFDIIELTESIIKKYSLLEDLEHYKFIFNHKEKEILVKADKKKIEQVIYNLINNAINYTGKDNTVTINITKKKNKDVLVEIIDSGKGIKEEDLPYIWDRYYKNKKKHKRNLIGTGLGLNIVKNIFEEHKYEYGVKTEIDKGSNFYFIIKNTVK